MSDARVGLEKRPLAPQHLECFSQHAPGVATHVLVVPPIMGDDRAVVVSRMMPRDVQIQLVVGRRVYLRVESPARSTASRRNIATAGVQM